MSSRRPASKTPHLAGRNLGSDGFLAGVSAASIAGPAFAPDSRRRKGPVGGIRFPRASLGQFLVGRWTSRTRSNIATEENGADRSHHPPLASFPGKGRGLWAAADLEAYTPARGSKNCASGMSRPSGVLGPEAVRGRARWVPAPQRSPTKRLRPASAPAARTRHRHLRRAEGTMGAVEELDPGSGRTLQGSPRRRPTPGTTLTVPQDCRRIPPGLGGPVILTTSSPVLLRQGRHGRLPMTWNRDGLVRSTKPVRPGRSGNTQFLAGASNRAAMNQGRSDAAPRSKRDDGSSCRGLP